MEEALLRDDAADEKGDEDDDGNRLPADTVDVIGRRGQSERTRIRHHPDN